MISARAATAPRYDLARAARGRDERGGREVHARLGCSLRGRVGNHSLGLPSTRVEVVVETSGIQEVDYLGSRVGQNVLVRPGASRGRDRTHPRCASDGRARDRTHPRRASRRHDATSRQRRPLFGVRRRGARDLCPDPARSGRRQGRGGPTRAAARASEPSLS